MLAYRAVALGVMLAVASALTGCSNNAPDSHPNVTLRLGHLTRITHASALVGIEKELFADHIGPAAKLGVQPFGQSTEEATALRSGTSTPPPWAPIPPSTPGRDPAAKPSKSSRVGRPAAAPWWSNPRRVDSSDEKSAISDG
jgi:hypothetical protein